MQGSGRAARVADGERSGRVAALRFSKSLCYMAAMKLRHAAALALVGWMIIIAPPGVSYDPTKWQLVDPAHPNVLTLLPPEFRDLRHWEIRSDKHGPLLYSLQSLRPRLPRPYYQAKS